MYNLCVRCSDAEKCAATDSERVRTCNLHASRKWVANASQLSFHTVWASAQWIHNVITWNRSWIILLNYYMIVISMYEKLIHFMSQSVMCRQRQAVNVEALMCLRIFRLYIEMTYLFKWNTMQLILNFCFAPTPSKLSTRIISNGDQWFVVLSVFLMVS